MKASVSDMKIKNAIKTISCVMYAKNIFFFGTIGLFINSCHLIEGENFSNRGGASAQLSERIEKATSESASVIAFKVAQEKNFFCFLAEDQATSTGNKKQLSGESLALTATPKKGNIYCSVNLLTGELDDLDADSKLTDGALYKGYLEEDDEELLFVDIAVASQAVCGIAENNKTYCLGADDGMLGNGSTSNKAKTEFVEVQMPSSDVVFSKLLGANDYFCGIGSEGGVYCWGDNTDDRLYTGTGSGTLHSPTKTVGNSSSTLAITEWYSMTSTGASSASKPISYLPIVHSTSATSIAMFNHQSGEVSIELIAGSASASKVLATVASPTAEILSDVFEKFSFSGSEVIYTSETKFSIYDTTQTPLSVIDTNDISNEYFEDGKLVSIAGLLLKGEGVALVEVDETLTSYFTDEGTVNPLSSLTPVTEIEIKYPLGTDPGYMFVLSEEASTGSIKTNLNLVFGVDVPGQGSASTGEYAEFSTMIDLKEAQE